MVLAPALAGDGKRYQISWCAGWSVGAGQLRWKCEEKASPAVRSPLAPLRVEIAQSGKEVH